MVTNDEITVGRGASITVSGRLIDRKITSNWAWATLPRGTLSINGGSITASTGITLGDCASNNVGRVILCGGQLTVTNTAGTGFIDIRNGQLVLSGGILQVDKLVMTNACAAASAIREGRSSSEVSYLNSNAFQITSITQEGNNVRIAWFCWGLGQTNALQASSGGIHGAYTHELFCRTSSS